MFPAPCTAALVLCQCVLQRRAHAAQIPYRPQESTIENFDGTDRCFECCLRRIVRQQAKGMEVVRVKQLADGRFGVVLRFLKREAA